MIQRQKSFSEQEIGQLYLVPTPIGNLEDMTYRAVRILSEADLIVSEDTRHTQKLLNHFHIQNSQLSFHEHNTQERIPLLLDYLKSGKTLAQVSDAGTPSISDPGFELVQACIQEGIPVIPLPGANAAITALIASGLVPQPFYFYGFLPRKKKERLECLKALKQHKETVILYESPFRLKELFEQIIIVYGLDQSLVLSRELTKRFEEFNRGTAQELLALVQEEELKGECCVLIGSQDPFAVTMEVEEDGDQMLLEGSLIEAVHWAMMEQGLTQKEAIKKVAKKRGIKKQEVYAAVHLE